MSLLPINLPKNSVTKVSKGERLTKGQIIAEVILEKEEVIHLAPYNINPKKFTQSLKKHLGDRVREGEVVAARKKIIINKKIKSPFSGTIVKIDEQAQDLYIKPNDFTEKRQMLSPVEGVVDFCDNEKVIIKTDALAIPAKDALGKSAQGKLLSDNFSSQNINSSVDGKIVASKTFDKPSVYKSFGLGAIGIIAQELPNFDFIDAKGMDKAVFVLGSKEFDSIKKLSGKEIFLDCENKSIIVL